MKDFDKDEYATAYVADMETKIPGYQLIFELIFSGVLPVELANRKPTHILSIGGGEIELERLAHSFPLAEITVIDPSSKMLDLTKERFEATSRLANHQFINLPFEEYPLTKEAELSLCLLVLHFIEDKQVFLGKLYQSLTADGIAIISVFTPYHLDWWQSFALSQGANQAEVRQMATNPAKLMAKAQSESIETVAKAAGFFEVEKIAHILPVEVWLLKKRQ